MNAIDQLRLLEKKQVAIDEGIRLLAQIQRELRETQRAADRWATIAVAAHLAQLTANILANGLGLGIAKTTYLSLSNALMKVYMDFGKGGLTWGSTLDAALSSFKTAITQELRRTGNAAMIPGVNVLVGLVDDTVALMKALQVTSTGNRDIAGRMQKLERDIARANAELVRLGILRSGILDHAGRVGRTA